MLYKVQLATERDCPVYEDHAILLAEAWRVSHDDPRVIYLMDHNVTSTVYTMAADHISGIHTHIHALRTL